MAKKILWVEDDYYHIQFLFHYLEKEGAVITPALSACDAYQIINKGTKFDLMVIDIILPISSSLEKLPEAVNEWKAEKYPGIGLVKWLKAIRNVDCPVVVLSVIDDPIQEYGLADLISMTPVPEKRFRPNRICGTESESFFRADYYLARTP